MPSNEDLYQEMARKDDDDAVKFGVLPKPTPPRKLPNESAARDRYEKEIAPVIARVKRAQAGLPITNSWWKNLQLRVTGKDKVPTPEVIEPSKEFQIIKPIPNDPTTRPEHISRKG